MTLNLPPELEERLTHVAGQHGIPADEYALRLLEEHLPPPDGRAALVALLQSWIDEEDGEEQKETGDYLIRVLDDDRLSERKLFPADLKGVTW